MVQDHPRRCGENPSILLFSDPYLGSPPQVRGKHRWSFRTCASSGITPAGAGKTFEAVIRSGSSQDHPRRCGENSGAESGYSAMIGSPPQVRGKPIPNPSAHGGSRITPAGAGKTMQKLGVAKVGRDHPRRCGENALSFSFSI